MQEKPAPASWRATPPARALAGFVSGALLLLGGAGCTRGADEGAAAPRGKPADADEPAERSPAADDDAGAGPAGGGAAADPAAVAADPSAGCAGVGPDVALPGDEEVVLDVDGTDRSYLRHVPPSYDGSTPMPLILDLPGYAIEAELEPDITGIAAAGDSAGYITVTPEALGDPPHWDTRVDGPDVDVVDRMLDDLEGALCLDRNRVFATGFSGGAFMASTLACALADRIAAVAPVAGLRDVPDCDTGRPVPVLTFHGTGDSFLPYDGGVGPGLAALPSPDGSDGRLGDVLAGDDSLVPGSIDEAVPDIVGAWADRNGCDPEPDEGPVADDVALLEFTCPAGASVELYRVRDGGHTWPGSDGTATFEYVTGATTFSIDATALIWDFFTTHPLPT